MKVSKRILSFILSGIVTLTLSSAVFAEPQQISPKDKAAKNAEVFSQLEKIGKNHGYTITPVSEEEAANAQLTFATVEEFDKWLDKVKIQTKVTYLEDEVYPSDISTKDSSSTISDSTTLLKDGKTGSSTTAVTSTYYTRVCTADNTCYLEYDGDVFHLVSLGTIRQKLVTSVTWNYTFQKYVFMSIDSQTSYISGTSYSGWNYTEDYKYSGRCDSLRTAYGRVLGHCTLTASVAGVGAGFTWDTDYYNEWYAKSTL